MISKLILLFVLIYCCSSCGVNKTFHPLNTSETNVLDSLLKTRETLTSVVRNKDSFNLQVIYTKIDRDENNKARFTDYTFNVDDEKYFYPASTVKLPASLLALEKLNEIQASGVNKHTTMRIDSNYTVGPIGSNNLTDTGRRQTVGNCIKEIFLVSDNDAFNRLYEFLGQDYLNSRLHKKGYKSAEIRHRLDITLSDDQNRRTGPVSFYDTSGTLLYHQPARFNSRTFAIRENKAGKGFYRDGQLINESFDFSAKNKIALTDLHNMLRAVIFPEVVSARQRFSLTDGDYRFLYKYMSAKPRESVYPYYDSSEYPDAYCKFLMFGSQKQAMPGHIRIFNKIGDAYGFLIDVAYIVDFDNDIEFMLSATILCNSDGIYNDDHYDYDTVGFPFMKSLGQVVYDYEKQRQRKNVPDLSKFKIDYKD